MMGRLSTLDWLIVAGYFVATLIVAIWASRRERQNSDTAQYFLAGRHTGWFIVGASLFASNIGSEHLVGLAGTGAASGIAVAQFEIMAGLVLLILGWVFVPFYLRSGVFTMPEFLERRYSSGARTYLATISIISYVITKISVTVAAGGIVFETLMGIDFWTGAVIVVLFTGAYTLIGGLAAVMYTDMMQMFVLLGGSVFVTVIGVEAVGGWSALQAAAGPGYFDLWQPSTHPDFPWTGILFGAPILGVWYWCTDQFIVQRVLAAKNEAEARRGAIFAGFLKQLPLFIFVVPGIVAYVLAKSGRIELASPDQALPALIAALLPAGLRGVVVAGLLAALMSSLSSVFNSCAALISIDVYKRINPRASERKLVLVGQVAVGALVLLALAWIPMMSLISGRLYTYIQSVQAYISPPIAAVFLIGVMWPRANSQGAMASLLVGFALGIGRLLLEMNASSLSGVPLWLAKVNFLHVAVVLFAICSLVLVAVSLATARPPAEKVRNLTFSTLEGTAAKRALASGITSADWILSGALVLLICVIWFVFSG